MREAPVTVRGTSGLLGMNALIWAGFGFIVAADLHPAMPVSGQFRWVVAILAFMVAVMLVGLALLLRRQSRIAWYLTIGLLLIIAFFIVSDEFGIPDLVVLIITLLPIGLLLRDRAWYLTQEPSAQSDV